MRIRGYVMLIRFWVQGYRCFGKRVEIDLTDKKNYRFGKECVRGDFLDKMVVLGNNNAGKTAFGYAMTDIVSTVGGFSKDIGQHNVECFLNKDVGAERATFHYDLSRKGSVVSYEYSKSAPDRVVAEKLTVDRRTVFEYDLERPGMFFDPDLIEGCPAPDGKRSVILSMNESHAVDPGSPAGVVIEFATHSLYYMAMWKHDVHIGMIDEEDDAERFVVQNGHLDLFQSFLKEVCSIDVDLFADGDRIMIRKGSSALPFRESVSRGTMIACRLYAWTVRCRDRNALIYFDDFDDMFHYRMAENAIRTIISQNSAQCIFVTHNTGLVSNDFLRPDCCFIMADGELRSLSSLTDKDIRRGHNLEKMLREGEFDPKAESERTASRIPCQSSSHDVLDESRQAEGSKTRSTRGHLREDGEEAFDCRARTISTSR
ncbi:MAG: ATP-binding protein [Candidatus Methanomethylophilaceae archaeon]|nr:ATP-binding protein [Candidatus Methanomethylophilaceae archaeon]